MSQQIRAKLVATPALLGMIALCAGAARAESNSPLPLPNPFHVDETFKLELPAGMKSLGPLSGGEGRSRQQPLCGSPLRA